VPLLLNMDGHLAGFALINRLSRTGLAVDHNMAEFFVVRKHRRRGVGRAAAAEIFSRYRGRWELAMARRNVAALAFWREVIKSEPRVADLDEIDLRNSSWDGPVLRFGII
jgi:predicted acetyltransferase